jgi:hypothetical protein
MSLKTKDKNVVYQLFIFVSQGRPGVMIRSALLQFYQHYGLDAVCNLIF